MVTEILEGAGPEVLVSRANGLVSWDLETTSLLPRIGEITDCGFAWKEGGKLVNCSFLWDDNVLEAFKDMHKKPGIITCNQNIKFDLRWVQEKTKFDPSKNVKFDTLLIEHLIDPDRRKSLDMIAERYEVIDQEKLEWYRRMKAMRGNLASLEYEERYRYNCLDTELIHKILPKQKDHVNWSLYFNIELPLMVNLLKMEAAGIWLDEDYRDVSEQNLFTRRGEIAEGIYEIGEKQWNINSDAQTREILFGKLKLPILKYTDGGKNRSNPQPSIDAETLMELEKQTGHPIVKLLREHSRISDLMSRYINPYKEIVYPDGKIRTTWSQTGEIKGGTASGRLTSEFPPLQVLPNEEKAHEIFQPRKMIYSPHEDIWVLGVDADQVELRWMAWDCQETLMIEELRRPDGDIHAATAASIYRLPTKEITKVHRKIGKIGNFGIAYGVEAKALAKQIYQGTGIVVSIDEAKGIINSIRNKYRKIEDKKRSEKNFAMKNGYTENYVGRKRYWPRICEDSPVGWGQGRACFNHRIQGGASDFIKALLNIMCDYCDWSYTNWWPVMLVHDEIVFYVTTSEVYGLLELLEQAKREVPILDKMPYEFLPFTAKIGRNYGELVDINKWAAENKVVLAKAS